MIRAISWHSRHATGSALRASSGAAMQLSADSAQPVPADLGSVAKLYLLGLGVNAMQCPCGLMSPSTILQVPMALGVFPGMN